MRTYGKLNGKWVEVTTDASGYDDPCWLTTLCQCIKLQPGESPFYANYGIPAQQSVVSQIIPSYYVSLLQQQFAPRFASLQVSLDTTATNPTYNINVITNSGSQVVTSVAV